MKQVVNLKVTEDKGYIFFVITFVVFAIEKPNFYLRNKIKNLIAGDHLGGVTLNLVKEDNNLYNFYGKNTRISSR